MDRLCVVVFSKDRPLQLHAAITSMRARCRDSHLLEISVLFAASTFEMARRYEALKNELPFVGFIEQTNNNDEVPLFNCDLLDIVRGSEYVMFVCDDAIFVRQWWVRSIIDELKRLPYLIGCSLRLGENTTYCYALDKPQAVPPSRPGYWRACNWATSEHDFGYPLELSSSIYRTKDVWGLLSGMYYRNPNELEEILNANKMAFAKTAPLLMYPQTSIAFCAPVNVVQSTHPNRAGQRADQSPEELAKRFDAGQRIDVRRLEGYTPKACHELLYEIPFHDIEVSVVIPCYNQGEFLRETVASVRAQTFQQFEIIIVNDGSTDNTDDICYELTNDCGDGRVMVVLQENAGLAAARNAGISAARGRFILPLDADDKLEGTFLSRTIELMRIDSTISVSYTDARVFGAREGVWACNRPFCTAALLQQNGLPYASLYRREVWEAIGGYNPNMTAGYEDWDFWLGAAAAGFRAAHIAEPLFLYREKTTGMLVKAREHHDSLVARMHLNHPELLYSAHLDRAQAQLERSPLPVVHGT